MLIQRAWSILRVAVAGAVLVALPSPAAADPVFSSLLNQYLIIGSGDAGTGNLFESVKLSNVELGANQEVLSTSTTTDSRSTSEYPGGLNLDSVFDQRWTDVDPNTAPNDTLGLADQLQGARTLFEGIDFSGNVAVMGTNAEFSFSNGDLNATTGIECNSNPASCYNTSSPDKNIWFSGPDPTADNGTQLAAGNGVTQFGAGEVSTLADDIGDAYEGLNTLLADTTLNTGFVNQNYKDSTAAILDLDAIDTNNDGYAVIDIFTDGKWELNNTDLILMSTEGTLAVFRMQGTGYFDFSNSSIMLGGSGGTITTIGAIFLVDQLASSDQLFNLNNVVLGGIALWDMTDWNNGTQYEYNARLTHDAQINLQNAQGCGQFIGHEVIMSNNRWTQCDFPTSVPVPEPATLTLLGLGLGAIAAVRRRRAQ